MLILHLDDLHLGKPTRAGHEIYLDASYADPAKKNRHVIFKRNKYHYPQFSRFELAFTQLARLFLSTHLTTPQQLVVDDAGVALGLVSEHLSYVIAEKEGLPKIFFSLTDPVMGCASSPVRATCEEEIPLYFLDKVPHGFFSKLVNAEHQGALNINYASLASLLSSSYTLEEDDLHKGNFGFYLVEKNGLPEVVFFKIDHDLMFTDSIMSFYRVRPQHLFCDKQAFVVAAEDIRDFPLLHRSVNAYWPTKKRIFTLFCNKEYRLREEIDAFASLALVPAFQKAKWMAFYKHILIPIELTELVLQESFDRKKAIDRAQIALMAQAVSARQARLRAMLFSLKEFRESVTGLGDLEKEALIEETLELCPEDHKEKIKAHMLSSIAFYEEQDFDECDTPLHTAIKLGDFRYEETMSMFGHLVNVPNKAGKTPLDCALALVSDACAPIDDVRQDCRLTMKYLLQHGATQSPAFKEFNRKEQIELYQYQTPYMDKVKRANSYQEFKEVLRDIGEDHQYCLKFKKKLAVDCVRHYIECNKNNSALHASLMQLKKELNQDAPELKYIRQLRSNLWIIRQIRGLYGWTTTQDEINTLIYQQAAVYKPQRQSLFFSACSLDCSNNDSSFTGIGSDSRSVIR